MLKLSRFTIFFAVTLNLILITGFDSLSFADAANFAENTTKIIHLGYLQIAAHDFFDMNRETEIDNENGKLDLSTVLFDPKGGQCNFTKSLNHEDGCALYDDTTIANGGEKRNVENIMISTASAEVGGLYLQIANLEGGEKAYQESLAFYHEKLKVAYEETYHLEFPEPTYGKVNNMHNLAMRATHDLLPAEIEFNGVLTSIFAIDPFGEKLSEEEKMQHSSPMDGVFDEEFLGIDFCPIPPFFCINVNLLEADRSFGEQFGLGSNTFDEFMHELEDGSMDENEDVAILIEDAFSLGLYLDIGPPVAGEILPLDSQSLVIAGLTSMSIWMIPAVAGFGVGGIYMIKRRSSKE